MSDGVTQLLFSLLRYEFGMESPKEDLGKSITPQVFSELYALSKSHDLAHLVGDALDKLDLLLIDNPITAKFQKQQMMAVYRFQRLNYELTAIETVLEENGIDYLPLKGAVIRGYYPEMWMRTSCDIDILVREEDLNRAVETLCERLSYRVEGERNYHDISLFSESGVHLELHFSIQENHPELDRALSQVWEYTEQKAGTHRYDQCKEYLIFHCVAHAAYHFLSGGCGIRPIMDLCILKQKLQYDEQKLLSLCRLAGVEIFYREMSLLSDVWFSQKEGTELTEKMERFILDAGTYGNLENKIAIQRGKRGGRLRYALSRLFLPYESLKEYYPSLERHKWLFPFFQVRRLFRLLFGGTMKRSMRELQMNQAVSAEQSEALIRLLDQLEL